MSDERSGLRDRLESVGDPRHIRWRERQTDYVKLCEVTGADVEELVAVAQEWADPQDDWPEDDENYVAGYAPLHAWRCLAHLEAPEAVEPLLAIVDTLDEQGDDWFLEDLPYVFAFVGPPAIDPLCAYLADDRHGTYSRICAGRGMELAAKRHPSTRARVIEGVGDVLRGFREHDPGLNAFLCGALLELKASEHYRLIEEAHAADCVDICVYGNWDTICRDFGLEDHGLVPRELASRRAMAIPGADALREAFLQANAAAEQQGTALHERLVADGATPKVGRNEPCPCGSGRKYKKCCGR